MYASLNERRAAVRDATNAKDYRYCRTRLAPGALGDSVQFAPTVLYEVDASGAVTRQVELFDHGWFTRRFSTDYPDDVHGRGIRRDPLGSTEIEATRTTHTEFEHVWLTGFIGQRSVADYSDELLCSAVDEGPQMLWECWIVAEQFFPYDTAAESLALTIRVVTKVVEEGLAELVIEVAPPEVIPIARSRDVLERPSAWMTSHGSPALQVTSKGIADLERRRLIRPRPPEPDA